MQYQFWFSIHFATAHIAINTTYTVTNASSTVETEAHQGILTNSTLHISSAKSYVPSDECKPLKSPSVFYRYIITMQEPQLIIFKVIICIGVLIFLFLIINLIVFSRSYQQKQAELLSQLTEVTQLNGSLFYIFQERHLSPIKLSQEIPISANRQLIKEWLQKWRLIDLIHLKESSKINGFLSQYL